MVSLFLKNSLFSYLDSEKSHSNEADPAVKRVKVLDALLVVVVQDSEEADDDAGECQSMKDGVKQLHVDPAEAAADAVQQDSWKC